MSWDAILKFIIEVSGKILTVLGGLTVLIAIIIGIAKLFFAKWFDLLFEKCIIRYKHRHDKDLAFKTAQYNSLIPEQRVIVKELYGKILRLHQSTKLLVELFDIFKEGFKKKPLDDIEDAENFEFDFDVIVVDKDSKEKHGRIFTMEEIERIGNYHSIKKEVEEYIQQNKIFVPEDISNNIEVTLFLIELFVTMNFPKEFIHYWTQNNFDREGRNKFVNEIESFKQDVGFDSVNLPEFIDSFFVFIQNQFRLLLGVENSNQ